MNIKFNIRTLKKYSIKKKNCAKMIVTTFVMSGCVHKSE